MEDADAGGARRELSIDFQANIPGAVRWEHRWQYYRIVEKLHDSPLGRTIELVSDDLLLEGKEVFIVTKDYGKINVTIQFQLHYQSLAQTITKSKTMELIK